VSRRPVTRPGAGLSHSFGVRNVTDDTPPTEDWLRLQRAHERRWEAFRDWKPCLDALPSFGPDRRLVQPIELDWRDCDQALPRLRPDGASDAVIVHDYSYCQVAVLWRTCGTVIWVCASGYTMGFCGTRFWAPPPACREAAV
jgi:hypothetical protein